MDLGGSLTVSEKVHALGVTPPIFVRNTWQAIALMHRSPASVKPFVSVFSSPQVSD